MTQYIDVYVNISDGQKQKLKHAIDAGCTITSLQLGKDDLEGVHKLAITTAQYNKLKRAVEQGKGITIRISKKQLKHNIKVEGGFLGLLAGLAARALPVLARTVLPALGVGALSELASAGSSIEMRVLAQLKFSITYDRSHPSNSFKQFNYYQFLLTFQ